MRSFKFTTDPWRTKFEYYLGELLEIMMRNRGSSIIEGKAEEGDKIYPTKMMRGRRT